MAVETTLIKSGLSMRYKEGIDERGNDINKIKKFSNIKVTAVNANLHDVAAAFSPLMKYPTLEVMRTDESVIISA